MAANDPGDAGVGGLDGQLGGVDQVAVVAQRQAGAGRGGAERRLGVLPGGGAGRGVAGVADREVAAQAAQRRLVEDLADQPEVLVDDDDGAVGHRDAGRLLTAVLEGVQTEVGQLRDLFPRRPDAEDATGVLRSGRLGVEVVRQPSITARHLPSVPARTTVPGCRWGERWPLLRAWGATSPRRDVRPFVRHAGRRAERRTRCPATDPTPASSSRRPSGCCASCSATRAAATTSPWAEATRSARESRASPAPSEQRENLTFALATRAVEALEDLALNVAAIRQRLERTSPDVAGRDDRTRPGVTARRRRGQPIVVATPRRSWCRRRARCARRCRRAGVSSRVADRREDRRVVAVRAAGGARARRRTACRR